MEFTLHGTATVLRPVRPEDADALAAILAEPDIARWWGRYDAERVRSELIGGDHSVVFAIEIDGEVVGSVQYFEEPAPDYRHASIDVFIGTKWHGQGLGTDAVRTLARYLIHDKGHHRLAIDPAVANERAIKTYQRVGFKPVGVMRSYERDADGQWHDCLLMDLLAKELD
jgi:aminoglycoside 6'-N-acetyltransferase